MYSLRVFTCLEFALQGGSCTVPGALINNHHHMGQRIHPYLLQLQVLLKELQKRKKKNLDENWKTCGFTMPNYRLRTFSIFWQ